MSVLWGAVIFIVTIVVALITHEFGHYLVAKRFGVVADEFSIGMGKRAIISFTKGQTKWSIRPLPLGAYCNFIDKTGGLNELSPGRKIAVYLAGPMTNIFFGMVLFMIASAMLGRNVFIAIGTYFVSGFSITGEALAALGKVFSLDTYSSVSGGVFSGVIQQFSGVTAVSLVLMIAAIIMFILGISNLLPFPSFDGGHILFTIFERFGKKVGQKAINKINYACFMAVSIFALMILAEAGLGFIYKAAS